jgi:2OG-Fe(II) oxygenase superfamily
MRWLRWEVGRQGTGYEKMLLATARWPLPFDCYLLRYRPGSSIPFHTDPVDGRRHYRLNVVLRRAVGGAFELDGAPIWRVGRAVLFRPDLGRHAVSMVDRGTRYVLSIGWVRPPAVRDPSN